MPDPASANRPPSVDPQQSDRRNKPVCTALGLEGRRVTQHREKGPPLQPHRRRASSAVAAICISAPIARKPRKRLGRPRQRVSPETASASAQERRPRRAAPNKESRTAPRPAPDRADARGEIALTWRCARTWATAATSVAGIQRSREVHRLRSRSPGGGARPFSNAPSPAVRGAKPGPATPFSAVPGWKKAREASMVPARPSRHASRTISPPIRRKSPEPGPCSMRRAPQRPNPPRPRIRSSLLLLPAALGPLAGPARAQIDDAPHPRRRSRHRPASSERNGHDAVGTPPRSRRS